MSVGHDATSFGMTLLDKNFAKAHYNPSQKYVVIYVVLMVPIVICSFAGAVGVFVAFKTPALGLCMQV